MGAWVASFFSYGFALAPRATRFLASVFAIETVADNLHLDYESAKKANK
jgi:hypothetical protein